MRCGGRGFTLIGCNLGIGTRGFFHEKALACFKKNYINGLLDADEKW